MTRQTEILMMNSLQFKYQFDNQHLELNDINSEVLKNVCAKVSPQLVNRLDNALKILGISKRVFVEMAIINALDEFDEISSNLDIYEGFEERGDNSVVTPPLEVKK